MAITCEMSFESRYKKNYLCKIYNYFLIGSQYAANKITSHILHLPKKLFYISLFAPLFIQKKPVNFHFQ